MIFFCKEHGTIFVKVWGGTALNGPYGEDFMKNKILVIEDDESISSLICMNLEAAGYDACPVADGKRNGNFFKAQGIYPVRACGK